jgi:hypothetical protein
MKELFEVVGELLSNFTWKRFFAFVISAVILVAFFVTYERYTNSFALSRIGKQAEILRTLQLIQKEGIPKDSELETIYERLLADLADASSRVPSAVPQPRLPQPGTLQAKWKFLAGASYWWLLAVIGLWELYRGTRHARGVMTFFFFAGAFFGLVGMLVPSFNWVFNYVAYPILGPVLLLAVFLAIAGMAGVLSNAGAQSEINRTLEQGFKEKAP